MPTYTDLNGNPVSATDPKRFVWYGAATCGYWTDDQSKLKKFGPGIPCCPHCMSPGMQTTAGDWDEGVIAYSKANPGYADFIASGKEKCWREDGGFKKAWEAAPKTPPCRVCKKAGEIICYPDDHSLAICPECCDKVEEHPDGEKGHQWEHDKWDGWQCKYCGIPRNCTEYEEDFIDRG